MRLRAAAVLAAAFWFAFPMAIGAHDPGLSSLDVQVAPEGITATLSLASADRVVVEEQRGDLGGFALDAIALTIDGVQLRGAVQGQSSDAGPGTSVTLAFPVVAGSKLMVRAAVPGGLARGHRTLLTVRAAGGELLAERMLDGPNSDLEVDLTVGRPGAVAAVQFFGLGITHILGGYDHLLFLAALLLGVRRLGDVVKTVTAFTVAHSLTLGLAVLDLVHLPAAVVEPMIAVSIVFVGLENLVREQMESRWKLTFAFGLVHGFGFAGALQELGVGGRGMDVVKALGSFNVGVETGQIAVALVLWPLVRRLSTWSVQRFHLAPACSVLVVAAGVYWLVERTLF
jgi:hydrogenase/urease accessory protein HupE